MADLTDNQKGIAYTAGAYLLMQAINAVDPSNSINGLLKESLTYLFPLGTAVATTKGETRSTIIGVVSGLHIDNLVGNTINLMKEDLNQNPFMYAIRQWLIGGDNIFRVGPTHFWDIPIKIATGYAAYHVADRAE